MTTHMSVLCNCGEIHPSLDVWQSCPMSRRPKRLDLRAAPILTTYRPEPLGQGQWLRRAVLAIVAVVVMVELVIAIVHRAPPP